MTIFKSLKNRFLVLLGVSLLFVACNNNKKHQEDLQKSVIAVHDSVMTEMGTLMEKKTEINKMLTHLDSLKSANPNLDTIQVRTDLTKVIAELASADEGMMNWMHNFNPDYTGKSHEEVMTYLDEQKVKINSVDGSIKTVILKSDSVIMKYK